MSDRNPPRAARLVPRAELRSWRRWQTTELRAEGATLDTVADEVDPAEDPAALEAEREALREAARQAGHAEGYAAGYAEGFAAGREAGHAEGLAAGHAEGSQLAQAPLDAQANLLKGVALQAREAVDGLAHGMTGALTRLALQIARHVVADTLAQHPAAVAHLVRQMLQEHAADALPVQLLVNTEDAAVIEANLGDALKEAGWRIVPDATVARGGCRVRSRLGEIDASLETRWRYACAAIGMDDPWQPT